MNTISRKFEFDAGHRVLYHGGKCRYLHGHRYAAWVTIQSKDLDNLGRVIDFGEVKTLIGTWIDEMWDHNMILHPDDPLTKFTDIVGREPFIMPKEHANPTAENIAIVLFYTAARILEHIEGLRVDRVRIYETPNCFAEWSGL